MMNELEWYLVDLLQGYLTYDDKPVQVVKNFNQNPSRPVITLDIQSVIVQKIYNDPSLCERHWDYRSDININLWCDNEAQRQSLVEQILDCFYNEQTSHYRYCPNYEDGNCKTLESVCPATTRTNCKCPKPDAYGFTSLQYRHNIVHGSLMVEHPFELDEVSDHPPLLRSIFRCTADYVIIKGMPVPVKKVDIGEVGVIERPNYELVDDEENPDGSDDGDDPSDTNP